MMRDIIFRGKTIDGGKWLYGFYHTHLTKDGTTANKTIIHHIYTTDFDKFVNGDTVGQYTGLTDKHGVKLFEGDIVKFHGDYIRLIKYSDMMAGFITMYADNGQLYPGCKINHYDDFEIIGNITDNPELIIRGVK